MASVELYKCIEIWESYGHRGEYTGWRTEALARNHGRYEIDVVSQSCVMLSDSEIKDLNEDKPIFE